MSFNHLPLVICRRDAVLSEIAELADRINALKQELVELDVAERFLSRLVASQPFPEQAELLADAHVEKPPGRPDGIPTMPEMILEVLETVKNRGSHPGMEPRQIVTAISERWWPGVPSELVGPTAWRMWKQGRLAKNGAVYMPVDQA